MQPAICSNLSNMISPFPANPNQLLLKRHDQPFPCNQQSALTWAACSALSQYHTEKLFFSYHLRVHPVIGFLFLYLYSMHIVRSAACTRRPPHRASNQGRAIYRGRDTDSCIDHHTTPLIFIDSAPTELKGTLKGQCHEICDPPFFHGYNLSWHHIIMTKFLEYGFDFAQIIILT